MSCKIIKKILTISITVLILFGSLLADNKCKKKNLLSKKKIKLCHIDVNTYKSTRKAFYFVEKRMLKNGIIIFDDYGMFGADSIKKFINSIKKKYNKKYTFLYNFMGQCILVKK